jgi:hypothetical protein
MRYVTVCEGKYTICLPEKAEEDFKALRYGDDWRDLTGDGMVLALCHEIEELRERLNIKDEYER